MAVPKYVKDLARDAKKAKTARDADAVLKKTEQLAKSSSPTKRGYGRAIALALAGMTVAGLAVFKYKGGEVKDLSNWVRDALYRFGRKISPNAASQTAHKQSTALVKLDPHVNPSSKQYAAWMKTLGLDPKNKDMTMGNANRAYAPYKRLLEENYKPAEYYDIAFAHKGLRAAFRGNTNAHMFPAMYRRPHTGKGQAPERVYRPTQVPHPNKYGEKALPGQVWVEDED